MTVVLVLGFIAAITLGVVVGQRSRAALDRESLRARALRLVRSRARSLLDRDS